MYSDDLFNNILCTPVTKGADHLHVVSGYATAAMAFHHINHINKQGHDIKVNLIVGMCPNDGLSISNHNGFIKLVEDDFAGRFECSYVMSPPAVHSKVYIWTKDEKPIFGFAGSANYTQNAFRSRQREAMAACDPTVAYEYYQHLLSDTIYCTHNDTEDIIQLYKENFTRKKKQITEQEDVENQNVQGLEHVKVTFINRFGKISEGSGLNWGLRGGKGGREPSQAYIPLKSDIYKSDFFPPRKQHFTVHTDDGKILICSRAQENGKAIHTPHNNSLIGEYFRYRLGVANGEFITMDDLLNYGRTDVDFYKIDDETYYMDFSV